MTQHTIHTVIVPPIIQARLTGAVMARVYSDGFVEHTYEDGCIETATLSAAERQLAAESWFGLVGIVQSKRNASAIHDAD